MLWRVLGPLEVRAGDAWAQIGAPKIRALLAALLAAPGQVVPTERLVDELWGGVPPPGARKLVSQYVLRLRKLIDDRAGEVLTTQAPGYRLIAGGEDLDAGRFERLLAQAREAMAADDPGHAAEQCAEALAMWRGQALADVPLGPLAAAEAARLDELRLVASDLRVEADLRRGLGTELVPELRRLTGAHPLRERFWCQLVRALEAAGRAAEALAAFEQARQVIADELGANPGPELQRLYYELLAGDPPPRPDRRPRADVSPATAGQAPVTAGHAPAAAGPVPRQLPGAVPHFVGREAELDLLSGLLAVPADTANAVVISAIGGTAGVGKTALAVHWAHQAAGRFPDGQLYVNLRGYDPGPPVAPADALAAFLRALGLPDQEIPVEADERAAIYRSMLAGRRMLVLLDNANDEEQVRPLLPGTASCTAVVTSRSSLAGLVARDGARRVELDPLPLAEAASLLRALIGERAAAEPMVTAALADRCGRLPLTLRVVAERAAARPAAALADVATELADEQRRLDFLGAGGDPRTAARAVFSWSYRHLDASAALMFRQAGAHPGADFDVHAMAALADATLATTRRLLDLLAGVHLIWPAGPDRYGLHDLLRAYARELHTEHEDAGERRAELTRLFDYYLRTTAAAVDALFPAEHHSRYRIPPPSSPAPAVTTPGQARAWLDAQRATLVMVAGQTATQGWPRHAIMLASTLAHYLRGAGYWTEATALHGHALRAARAEGDRIAEADALISLAMIDWERGHWQQATGQLEQALALSRDPGDGRAEATALTGLALIDIQQGRSQRATSRLEHALALFREVRDGPGQAHVLGDLGGIDLVQGRHESAAARLRQSMSLARASGNRPIEGHALTRLGVLEARRGHLRQATVYQERALTVFQEIGNRNGQAEAYFRLGRNDWRQGRYQRGRDQLRRALAMFREIGDGSGEAHTLTALGAIDLREGRYERAAGQIEQAVALAHETGDRLVEAASLATLGDVCQRQGRSWQATHRYHQALALLRETGERPGQSEALNGLGEVALAAGQPDHAHRQHTAALGLAVEEGLSHERARAHDGIGHACLALGRPGQARQHWEKALAIYTEYGCPEADPIRDRLCRTGQDDLAG